MIGPLARDLNAHEILFDPSDSRPIYIGVNQEFSATITSDQWQIFQFTYLTTTSSEVSRIRRTRGAYNNRVGLFP